jgi:hypothetical protein
LKISLEVTNIHVSSTSRWAPGCTGMRLPNPNVRVKNENADLQPVPNSEYVIVAVFGIILQLANRTRLTNTKVEI